MISRVCTRYFVHSVLAALMLPIVSCATSPADSTADETTAPVESTTTAPATTTTRATTTTMPVPGIPVATRTIAVRGCYSISDGTTATSVNCDVLHDGQVFSTGHRLTTVAVTEDDPLRWRSAALAECGRDFRTFTGYDANSEDSAWDLDVILEEEGAGTPVVSCTVVRVDGAQWAGTAESITGSYLGIEVGDCFDFPTDRANAIEIDCNQPHEGEMFVVDAPLDFLGEDAPYPTDEEWNEIASDLCDGKFERYTGVDPLDASSELSYVFLFTLEPDWNYPEDRLLSCAVVMYDGTRMSQSVRR